MFDIIYLLRILGNRINVANHLSGTRSKTAVHADYWGTAIIGGGSFTERGHVHTSAVQWLTRNTPPGLSSISLYANTFFRRFRQREFVLVELITVFPYTPHHGQQFSRDCMPGVTGDYAILHHPFIIVFEGILFLVYRRQGGAENRVFQDTISRPG